MRAETRWSALVAVEALLVLFLLVFGNTFTNAIPFHRLQLLILAALGGVGWLLILARPGALPRLVLLAPLPLLLAQGITSVTSGTPSLAWQAVWWTGAYIGVGWLLCIQARHPLGRRNLVAAMAMVACIIVAAYFVQVALAWSDWLSLGFGPTTLPLRPTSGGGVLELPTWVADVVAITGPPAIAWLWTLGVPARRAAVVLAAALVAALAITGVRTVWLLALGIVGVAVVVAVQERGAQRIPRAAIVGAGLIGTIGLGVILLSGRSFDEGRISAYISAAGQFQASPLVGTGPATYGVQRLRDPVEELAHLAFPDAHNTVLTAAGESGVLGILSLGLFAVLCVAAVRASWRANREDRLTKWAAIAGPLVVIGHAQVDVAFALIGVALLLLAGLALAVAHAPLDAAGPAKPRSRWPTAVVAGGAVIVLVASSFVIRNEGTLDVLAAADAAADADRPADAFLLAREATNRAPDLAPAWWVRMVAAQAAGDPEDALDAALHLGRLEGFGQVWMSVAFLLADLDDPGKARSYMDIAGNRIPIDPLVELNGVALYELVGSDVGARISAERLLLRRPDIEPILSAWPTPLRDEVAAARNGAISGAVALGAYDTAVMLALYGGDEGQARSLATDALAAGQPFAGEVVAAWFDPAQRDAFDGVSQQRPTFDRLLWSWRLAVQACDRPAVKHWERAVEIFAGVHPDLPTRLIVAPEAQVRLFPNDYPGVVWRIDYPKRAYVAGIWTFERGLPACVADPG